MPVGRELMIKPPAAAACGFGRRPTRVFGPATAVACDRLALPQDVGRTIIACSSRSESREPLRANEEGLGRVTVAPETACRTALLRLGRPVEAADATGDILGWAPGDRG